MAAKLTVAERGESRERGWWLAASFAIGLAIATAGTAQAAADIAPGCRTGQAASLLASGSEAGAADGVGEGAEGDAGEASDEDEARLAVVDCGVVADDGSLAHLQIQFLELNELAVSALFKGWLTGEFAAVLGTTNAIAETPAAREMRVILDRFAEFRGPLSAGRLSFALHDRDVIEERGLEDPQRREMGHQDTAPRDLLYALAQHGAVNAGIAYLRYEIAPSPADIAALDEPDWPPGTRLWYGLQDQLHELEHRQSNISSRLQRLPAEPVDADAGAPAQADAAAAEDEGGGADDAETVADLMARKRDLLENVIAWRYLTPGDLAGFHDDQKRYRRLVADGPLAPGERLDSLPRFQEMGRTHGGDELAVPKFIDAMGYFTRGDFPADFTPVFQGLYRGSWETFFFPRRVHLRVAILVNRGAAPLSVRQLGLVQSRDVHLRKADTDGFVVEGTVALPDDGEVTLAPGERMTVPLAILLAYEPQIADMFAAQSAARHIHGTIAAHHEETAIEYHDVAQWFELLWAEPLVQKDAGSFTPPERPDLTPYVHDVAARLASIETRGGRVRMPGVDVPSIALSFTAHSEGAQCPHLYQWSEDDGRLRLVGKVLVSSDYDYDARHQRVALDRPGLRFRIAEEENEVSHIDRVRLDIRLADGREISIAPDHHTLAEADGDAVVLVAGEAIDFEFALPQGIAHSDIADATLDISGHYVRYGRLLLTQRSRP
ncbi:MAG: hypothetical protein NW205_06720 [Hyphomicrobiaceae bacterium]|nr:hypothetical protein [Hyphomicrobiaceae bacterium]